MDRHSDATEEIGDGAANVAKRLEKTQSCLIKKKEAKKRAKERKDAGAIVVVNLCTEERAEGESEKEKDVEKKINTRPSNHAPLPVGKGQNMKRVKSCAKKRNNIPVLSSAYKKMRTRVRLQFQILPEYLGQGPQEPNVATLEKMVAAF